MFMIIKKIFEGKYDEEVHSDFLKFGRGEYKDKYLIQGKKQGEKWSIKTGYEYANTLVRLCLPKEKVKVSGVIVATFDVSKEMKFPVERVKNFMGIRQAVINTEVEPKEILELMDKYPRVFFALSFSTPACELKIKAKAPKSAKPSTKEAESDDDLKIDFCSLKTTDKEIVKELFFDITDFKEILIKHILKINEIIYPKNEKDPVKVRELSKRKGVLVRKMTVDGLPSTKEHEFLA
jgi:hypothetical protein